MKRELLIREARSYLETTYHHQGRLKNVGIDCVGVIAGLAQFTGTKYEDVIGYDPLGLTVDLPAEFRKWFKEIPVDQAKPGDILALWIRRPVEIVHVGLKTDYGILHTHATVGKVVEHTLNERWGSRVVLAFQFSGIED